MPLRSHGYEIVYTLPGGEHHTDRVTFDTTNQDAPSLAGARFQSIDALRIAMAVQGIEILALTRFEEGRVDIAAQHQETDFSALQVDIEIEIPAPSDWSARRQDPGRMGMGRRLGDAVPARRFVLVKTTVAAPEVLVRLDPKLAQPAEEEVGS